MIIITVTTTTIIIIIFIIIIITKITLTQLACLALFSIIKC